ncbi:hypothetical protein BpHYR1_017089 [Brachionus plicatilis]|uniref:Uncharacterized protein n=1 Tax=Brachionus plicatilis TaxID=10195 RepID=A0A3M7SAB8_BRAPC|nr:hypothetical protein BpHYR1_017089 [Brachionus plicatilis]
MVLQKEQYSTNLYKRIPSSAKTLKFSFLLFVLKNIAKSCILCKKGATKNEGFLFNFINAYLKLLYCRFQHEF